MFASNSGVGDPLRKILHLPLKYTTKNNQYCIPCLSGNRMKQEYIPVGCVTSAAVAVGGRGGVCLPRGMSACGGGCTPHPPMERQTPVKTLPFSK